MKITLEGDEFVGVMDALDHYVGTLPENERLRRFPQVKAVLERMEAAFLERIGEVPSTNLTDEEISKLPVLDLDAVCPQDKKA